jgi:hypothetical protein
MIKSRKMRWAGHMARMGEKSNAYRILVGKPERERPIGRPRRRWLDNVKMDFREAGYGGMNWIDRAQGRDQRRDFLKNAGKFLSSCIIGGFSRMVQLHDVIIFYSAFFQPSEANDLFNSVNVFFSDFLIGKIG